MRYYPYGFNLNYNQGKYTPEVQAVITRLENGGLFLVKTQRDSLAAKYTLFNANGGIPKLNYDSSISIDSSQATVAKCWDLGSNQSDLTQATSGARPSVITGGLNSLPVMRFDGVDDELIGNLAFTGGVFTYFIVSKYLAYTSGARTPMSNGGATGGFSYRISAGRTRNNVNNAVAAMADNVTPSAYEIVNVERSATPSANMYVGNVAQTITNATASFNTPVTDFRLGNRNGTSEFANVEIAEVLVYDKGLSSGERTAVYNHLKNKWGL